VAATTLLPMRDGWTNVFASPGTRDTPAGNAQPFFAITGPGWRGTRCHRRGGLSSSPPTAMVLLLGRITLGRSRGL